MNRITYICIIEFLYSSFRSSICQGSINFYVSRIFISKQEISSYMFLSWFRTIRLFCFTFLSFLTQSIQRLSLIRCIISLFYKHLCFFPILKKIKLKKIILVIVIISSFKFRIRIKIITSLCSLHGSKTIIIIHITRH